MASTVLPADVRINANHLRKVSDEILEACINEMHIIYIADYVGLYDSDKLAVIEKYLAQHLATLNIRRPDTEGLTGMMNKSITVARDQGLDQTEYGQMARRIAKQIGLEWGNDDKKAELKIF